MLPKVSPYNVTLLLGIATLCITQLTVVASPAENRLIHDLLHGYVVDERPVVNHAEPVVVRLGVVLQQIIDLDERMEQLTVNAWLTYSWTDINIRWSPTEYENVTDIRFQNGQLWQPDVLLYNSVDEAFDTTFKANIVAYSDGSITYIPPAILKINCKLDIRWWPFDEQQCFFKFGSWSYSGRQIDLTPGEFSIAEYMKNGEFVLLDVWTERTEKAYGDNQVFQHVKFYLRMRRRTLYFAVNLIMPCALTMILVVLGFTLDPFSCEKVGLQISVALAIVVFSTMMTRMTPSTSEAVPLLGIFFQSCMIISVAATAFTVYVQSLHFRSINCSQRMSAEARYFFLELMPWLLRIKTPRRVVTLATVRASFRQSRRAAAVAAAAADEPLSHDEIEKASAFLNDF